MLGETCLRGVDEFGFIKSYPHQYIAFTELNEAAVNTVSPKSPLTIP